jgi:hypothetical protein
LYNVVRSGRRRPNCLLTLPAALSGNALMFKSSCPPDWNTRSSLLYVSYTAANGTRLKGPRFQLPQTVSPRLTVPARITTYRVFYCQPSYTSNHKVRYSSHICRTTFPSHQCYTEYMLPTCRPLISPSLADPIFSSWRDKAPSCVVCEESCTQSAFAAGYPRQVG